MEVLVIAAIAGAGALATWVADRRRSRRRNRSGRCATCDTTWAGSSIQEAYLIHGRLVCKACAAKARRRMPWELGAVAVFSMVALASATAAQGATAVVLFSAFGTAGMLVGAVQLMKLANRRAQRRIANGDYPDIALVGSGEKPRNDTFDQDQQPDTAMPRRRDPGVSRIDP